MGRNIARYVILYTPYCHYTNRSPFDVDTAPLDISDGIERLLKPFEKIGLPAHELAIMMVIALRFIPTLVEEAGRIQKAQMSRGADFTGNPIKRLRKIASLLVPLMISAFRRAEELAVAMEAR